MRGHAAAMRYVCSMRGMTWLFRNHASVRICGAKRSGVVGRMCFPGWVVDVGVISGVCVAKASRGEEREKKKGRRMRREGKTKEGR